MRITFLVLAALIIAIGVVNLSSCRQQLDDPKVLGPTTQTGILTGTGVTLLRRGTHVLLINDQPAFYIESKSTDLQPYEDQEVTVKGVSQANVYAHQLPVIVVESIQTTRATGVRDWNIPALNIGLKTPADWTGSIQAGTAYFRAPGSDAPVLTIIRKSEDVLPEGTSSVIKGHRAVRVSRSSFEHDIYILDGDRTLALHFTPVIDLDGSVGDAAQTLDTILRSLRFLTNASSSADGMTGSGSGLPCGGTAGVLCQSGYYCDVTDRSLNIGKCKMR